MSEVITIDERYRRAEALILENTKGDVLNGFIKPNWIGISGNFWYMKEVENGELIGKKFMYVDIEKNKICEAFDHKKLVEHLRVELEEDFDPNNLPFNEISYNDDKKIINFNLKEKVFYYDVENDSLQVEKNNEIKISNTECISPDKKWSVFVKDNNLFIKSTTNDEVIQITEDGEENYSYGTYPGNRLTGLYEHLNDIQLKPVVKWAPDSEKILLYRLDEKKIKKMHMVQSVPLDGTIRPKLHSYAYPLPEDNEVPMAELYVYHLLAKKLVKVKTNPIFLHKKSLFEEESKLVSWALNGTDIYIVRLMEDHQTVQFEIADSDTGESRFIFEEESDTFLHFDRHNLGDISPGQEYVKPNIYLTSNSKKLIWNSERDGWSHLYLYDCQTGELINQITKGSWVVRRLLEVNEESEWIYFTASGKESGRDPYLQHLYKIKFDGSDMQLLTPEDAEHIINFSPNLQFFVDNYSRVDLAPKSVLRSIDGTLIQELETANIERLLKKGYQIPKRIVVKARDEETNLYGIMVCPRDYDQNSKYPIIDYVYGGPQKINTPKSFMYAWKDLNEQRDLLGGAQYFSQIGFVTVIIDGLGTPYRSKAFHDYSYGKLEEAAGIEDHVTGIKQLAKQYPFIDVHKVGTWGLSGGGYASTRALLTYPDFYKVAVSAAGNHDNRLYNSLWGDRYQGKGGTYEKQDNAVLVENLEGKLLLAHGDTDDNVHPAQTIRMVDALIKADKDFDLLIMPNRHHALSLDYYFMRKKWDYFVEHLLGENPPKEFKIKITQEK